LWYEIKTKTRITMAVWAPLSLRQLVIEAAHTSRDGGHRGETMTIDRVRLGYYWPGMTSELSLAADASTSTKPAPRPKFEEKHINQ
jgi:hypothetical protein